MTNTNVIVTGGAGYIGPHVCKSLSRAGYCPVSIDDLSTGNKSVVYYGPLEIGDIKDRNFVVALMAKYKPEAVIHLAACVNVGEATTDPGKYWNNNLVGSLNLVECSIIAGCKKLIFSSTSAVYGNNTQGMVDEFSPTTPMNAYGASKLAVEALLRDFSNSNGVKCVSFRLFNVAGADPVDDLGESFIKRQHLIPRILDKMAAGGGKFEVFGVNYPTDDGTCIRDYVHVMDIAEAHVLALQSMDTLEGPQIFNLGSGKGYSVLEVISACERVTGYTLKRVYKPRRSGDAINLVAEGMQSRNKLGIQFERSNIKLIIEHSWKWRKIQSDRVN